MTSQTVLLILLGFMILAILLTGAILVLVIVLRKNQKKTGPAERAAERFVQRRLVKLYSPTGLLQDSVFKSPDEYERWLAAGAPGGQERNLAVIRQWLDEHQPHG